MKVSKERLTQIVTEELKEAFPPGERQQRRKARTDEFFKDVAERYSASSPENLGILKVAVEEYFQNNQLHDSPEAVSMRGFDEWFKERRSGYKKTALQEIIKEELKEQMSVAGKQDDLLLQEIDLKKAASTAMKWIKAPFQGLNKKLEAALADEKIRSQLDAMLQQMQAGAGQSDIAEGEREDNLARAEKYTQLANAVRSDKSGAWERTKEKEFNDPWAADSAAKAGGVSAMLATMITTSSYGAYLTAIVGSPVVAITAGAAGAAAAGFGLVLFLKYLKEKRIDSKDLLRRQGKVQENNIKVSQTKLKQIIQEELKEQMSVAGKQDDLLLQEIDLKKAASTAMKWLKAPFKGFNTMVKKAFATEQITSALDTLIQQMQAGSGQGDDGGTEKAGQLAHEAWEPDFVNRVGVGDGTDHGYDSPQNVTKRFHAEKDPFFGKSFRKEADMMVPIAGSLATLMVTLPAYKTLQALVGTFLAPYVGVIAIPIAGFILVLLLMRLKYKKIDAKNLLRKQGKIAQENKIKTSQTKLNQIIKEETKKYLKEKKRGFNKSR